MWTPADQSFPNLYAVKGSLVQHKDDANAASSDGDDTSDASSSVHEDVQVQVDVRFREVRDRINRLFRLSLLLRQEGARKREAKALMFEPLDPGGAPLATEFNSYVDKVLMRTFDHREADGRTASTFLPDFMRKRLKRVIEARWRRLSHGNHHANALAGRGSGTATDMELPKLRNTMGSKLDGRSPQPTAQMPTVLATRTVAKVLPSRPASAASTAPRDLTYDSKAPAKALSTGTATTKIRPKKISLPHPPALKGNAEEFECPYCHMIRSSKEQEKRLWQLVLRPARRIRSPPKTPGNTDCRIRVHVMHDLAPYICLFEDCTNPDLMFSTAGTWVSHMTEAHSKTTWDCAECHKQTSTKVGESSQRVFVTVEDYKAHISEAHPSSMDDDQLALLLQMDGRKQLRIGPCLFCGFLESSDHRGSIAGNQADLEEITKHIAEEHLHSLALLSLPWDQPNADDLHSAKASMSSNDGALTNPQNELKTSAAHPNTAGNPHAASFDEIRHNFPAEPKAATKSCQHAYCTSHESHCKVPGVEPWLVHPEIDLAAHVNRDTSEALWSSLANAYSAESMFPVGSTDLEKHSEGPIDSDFHMDNSESSDRDKQSALLDAAAAGDSHTLNELIKAGVDLTCTDSKGLNALQLAIKNDHIGCLDILLRSHNYLDSEPSEQSILCLAISVGNKCIVDRLISNGAHVDAVSGNFGSAMHLACSLGTIAILKSLLSEGASCDVTGSFDLTSFRELDVHSDEPWLRFSTIPSILTRLHCTPLTLAAYFGKLDVVNLLLEHQAKVDSLSTGWWNDSGNSYPSSCSATALNFATFGNNPGVVAALLDAGANIANVDSDGDTPFLQAVDLGTLDSLKILVDRNACTTDLDCYGRNALTRCVTANENPACLAWLIGLDLDVNHQSSQDGTTPLIAATRQHRGTRVIQMLLDAGALPDACDSEGRHPLYYAASSDDRAALELLLAHGASPTLVTNSGYTALIIAASRGLLSNVELLLANGATIDAADPDGRTPLFFAAFQGYHEVVAHLCVKGAVFDTKSKYGYTPLAIAARSGHIDTMRTLLTQPDINADSKDYRGWTALLEAAVGNHVKCLQILIGAGASIALTNQDGSTALDVATDYGHVDCVSLLAEVDTSTDRAVIIAARRGNAACLRVLLEAKASPNVRDDGGRSALMLASAYGYSECSRLLLGAGSNVCQLDKQGNSAVYYACNQRSIDCLQLLLDRGGDPNKQNNNGKTPLMITATSGSPEAISCAKLLVERGAHVDKNDNVGKTALSEAIFGSTDMMECLIDAGAQIDLPDPTGRTVLMHAVQCSFLQEAKTLIDRGAEVDFANPLSGMTALAYAISEGEYDMANFLATTGASVVTAINALGVSSLRTTHMHVMAELDKASSQSVTNTVSDGVPSVPPLDYKTDQQKDPHKPPSIAFLREIVAALTTRIDRLKADGHPLVALSPFVKAILRRKVAEIQHRRARNMRQSMSAKRVSFVPSSGAP